MKVKVKVKVFILGGECESETETEYTLLRNLSTNNLDIVVIKGPLYDSEIDFFCQNSHKKDLFMKN